MGFHSILFQMPDEHLERETPEAPDFFHDLNLDQIVGAVTAGWKEYDLTPFYYKPLSDLDAIAYRQEIIQDLEQGTLMQSMKSFSGQMRTARQRVDQVSTLDYSYFKYAVERRFAGSVETYCEAVQNFCRELGAIDLKSRGLLAFREYLNEYVQSTIFSGLVADLRNLTGQLSAVKYCLLFKDGSVTVRYCQGESDYSIAIEETFEKFKAEAANRRLQVPRWEGINHIETEIVNRVALLYPDAFQSLDRFYTAHAQFLDATISQFDREIQFYVAYLTYSEKFRRAGLSFCRPELSETSKEIDARNAFDLALAGKLVAENGAIVTNDFFLQGAERTFVVSGPNQGGKTTFARMIGQLHYLACLGCPVPGTEARLFVCDRIYTHFERQEDIANLRGKLQDDLVRIHRIFDSASSRSLIIMNEMFSSTALKDAVYLSKEVMKRISTLDLLCVWVTFLDELASFNEKTVSIVSTVNSKNPALRTFRLERRPPDGLAYALALAQNHRVTYEWLKERIKA